MTPDEHIAAIPEHAEQLGATATATGLDVPVPTCPGWAVRDVIGLLGDVHRWAASHVEEACTEPPTGNDLEQPPGDDELLEWFRAGSSRLVNVLDAPDDSLECWTFLPAPFPR